MNYDDDYAADRPALRGNGACPSAQPPRLTRNDLRGEGCYSAARGLREALRRFLDDDAPEARAAQDDGADAGTRG